MRRRFLITLGLLVAALGAVALLFGVSTGRAQEDQGVLAGFVSRLLSTPTSKVSIGAVEGALSSSATIRDVQVADADGVWLRIDTIRIDWRRAALFQRRLEVDRLVIGTITFSRRPRADRTAEPGVAEGPILPELPLRLQVGAFTLARLSLGEPVLGVAAAVSANGSLSLGPPSEGLNATIDLRRLDAPGQSALRLSFTPDTSQLALGLVHNEPAGGLLARLANLPGLPPVTLDLSGSGILDEFSARMAFVAGPGFSANGDARLVRVGAARQLSIESRAEVEGVLPPLAQQVFAGATQLTGRILFADDGAFEISRLTLTSRLAELVTEGRLSADGALNLRADVRALPGADGLSRLQGAEIGQLALNAMVVGTVTQPRVSARLTADRLRLPGFTLASLRSALAVEPVLAGANRFNVDVDGAVEGLKLDDPGLAQAVGQTLSLKIGGVADASGALDVSTARIDASGVSARFAGVVGPPRVDGTLSVVATDLSRFATVSGLMLRGSGSVETVLTGSPADRIVQARINGSARDLRTGLEQVDRLLDGRLTATGSLATTPNALGVTALRIAGAHVSAQADGRLAEVLGLKLSLALSDLARIDRRLTGAATAEADLTGPAGDPQLALRVAAPRLTALDRPVADVALAATIERVLSAPAFSVRATALADGRPARADLQGLAGAGRWSVSRLDAEMGSARIGGRVTSDPAGLLDGDLTLAIPDLDHLSVLLLTRLQGSLNGHVRLAAGNSRQDAEIVLQGAKLTADALALSGLTMDVRAQDVFGKPRLAGVLAADRLVAGGQTFDAVRLTATPATVEAVAASQLRVTASAQGFALATDATLVASEPPRLDVATLSATRDGRRIALVQPASVRAVAGGFQTERFTLGVNGGQVTLAGTAGDSLDLTVDVHRLPLATADIFAPGTGLTGTLDASARISGRAATPSGTYQLRATGVSVPALRAASVPPLSIDANGRVQDNRIGIEARIAAGATGTATVSGTAPLGDGDLALNARGRLEAGLLNALLAGSGRRVGGRVDIDTTLRGEPSAPQIGGSAIVTGGNFSDPVAGVAITGIDGRITGAGRQVIIERLTGRTRNGGTISATGRIDADPARGFPGALQIRSTASELVSNGVVRVVAALNLSVNGPLAAAPRIAGRVDVETIDVSVPERFGGAAAPLPNTRHIRPPPQTQARLAKQQRATGAAQRATPPFNAFLDITVDAPARIFVRGRGIDAELGGQIRLAGSTAAPQADGSFDLRRGRLVVLTQRLDFSRGRLLFQGSPIPDLDFVAETRAGGVTARVNVTGPANAPTFAFNSDPDLPQDEVLSRLLFARASGGLSAFQALQLAQAAAQFSGAGGDLDAFERTRRTLGVDDLDVNFGPAGPTVGVSRAIGDRVRLGVRAGARPEDSAVGVDIDLTRRLKLQGEVGADGRTSVGAGFEIEW